MYQFFVFFLNGLTIFYFLCTVPAISTRGGIGTRKTVRSISLPPDPLLRPELGELVAPLLPIAGEEEMEESKNKLGSNAGSKFSLSSDPTAQNNILTFRLSNRLAVAVCDTYDNYLTTGKPYVGQIMYNETIQTLRSEVPLGTCQSFKIKRCEDPNDKNCGWTKDPSC